MSKICSLPTGFRSPAMLAGLPESTPILVGFSGGADSHALLHMLAVEAQKSGARIYAAHVNHGIRGEEADRDEEFCRRTAEALSVPFFSCRVNIPALAEKSGKSVEVTAREARYDFFDRIMAEQHIPLLVTAHHADDNLETMLFHLIRGTGLTGLCGIPLCRRLKHGTLVRPLLSVTRREILDYCREHALAYVTDSTNTDTSYTRNRIRSQVIPALQAIQETAVENSARMAEHLRADSLCLTGMTDWFLEELLEDGSLELEKINGSPDAIVNRALMALFADLSEGFDLEHTHVQAIRALCQKGVPHSSVSLPGGMEGVIEEGRLIFRKKCAAPAYEPYALPLFEGNRTISQTNTEIVMRYSQKPINIYKNSILLSIDSAKINGVLQARSRKEGDRIRLRGMSRSIKKMFCDKKISRELRARLPILCDEDGVIAVPMLGVRDGAAATDACEKPLWIQVNFKENNDVHIPTVKSYAEEPDEKKQP